MQTRNGARSSVRAIHTVLQIRDILSGANMIWLGKYCGLSLCLLGSEAVGKHHQIYYRSRRSDELLTRSQSKLLTTTMSLLAPIICDNGTGFSKVGYVLLAMLRFTSTLHGTDSPATQIHHCKHGCTSQSQHAVHTVGY